MRKWWGALGAVTAVSVAAEIAGHDPGHSYFWWHDVPAFDLVYGFAGCVAIVLGSKTLGRLWLQRPEESGEEERR